jgi:hypothetical protein
LSPEREQQIRAQFKADSDGMPSWLVNSSSVGVLLAELDRVRAESEERLGELLFWHFEYREAMDNYRGEAAYAKQARTKALLEGAAVLDHRSLELGLDSGMTAGAGILRRMAAVPAVGEPQ